MSAVIFHSVKEIALYVKVFVNERKCVLFWASADARSAVFFSRLNFKSSNKDVKLSVRFSHRETLFSPASLEFGHFIRDGQSC
jgi:hypothetical protein